MKVTQYSSLQLDNVDLDFSPNVYQTNQNLNITTDQSELAPFLKFGIHNRLTFDNDNFAIMDDMYCLKIVREVEGEIICHEQLVVVEGVFLCKAT